LQQGKNEYVAGEDYTIADMAIWPWYGSIMTQAYGAQEFLSVHEYPNVKRWVDQVGDRRAVQRGRRVNTAFGPEELQLPERHDASDIDRALEAFEAWQRKQAEVEPA
jgi:GST-like protein